MGLERLDFDIPAAIVIFSSFVIAGLPAIALWIQASRRSAVHSGRTVPLSVRMFGGIAGANLVALTAASLAHNSLQDKYHGKMPEYQFILGQGIVVSSCFLIVTLLMSLREGKARSMVVLVLSVILAFIYGGSFALYLK